MTTENTSLPPLSEKQEKLLLLINKSYVLNDEGKDYLNNVLKNGWMNDEQVNWLYDTLTENQDQMEKIKNDYLSKMEPLVKKLEEKQSELEKDQLLTQVEKIDSIKNKIGKLNKKLYETREILKDINETKEIEKWFQNI